MNFMTIVAPDLSVRVTTTLAHLDLIQLSVMLFFGAHLVASFLGPYNSNQRSEPMSRSPSPLFTENFLHYGPNWTMV